MMLTGSLAVEAPTYIGVSPALGTGSHMLQEHGW